MNSYVAYTLGIHSELSLPELVAAAEAAQDVMIRMGKVELPSPEVKREKGCFFLTPHEAYFFWETIGTFRVRGGNEITIDALPDAEEKAVRFCLLGWPLAALLYQRGFLVLHGSAIDINGRAAAFLGVKGQGKSTMAATLYGRGHPLLTDDAVVLDMSQSGSPLVFPGFPQFKLFPEAAASSLGDDPETLPKLFSRHFKHARHAHENFAPEPVPLKRIYVLCMGEAPEIESLTPQEAMLHLIAHSYVVQFGRQLLQGAGAASHFRECSTLLNRVPVAWLRRHSALEALPEIARLVETDIARD